MKEISGEFVCMYICMYVCMLMCKVFQLFHGRNIHPIGIDFESPRPNPADKASIFAPVNPNGKKDEYDSKKCGLDCVVYLHASNANPLEQDKLLGSYLTET